MPALELLPMLPSNPVGRKQQQKDSTQTMLHVCACLLFACLLAYLLTACAVYGATQGEVRGAVRVYTVQVSV